MPDAPLLPIGTPMRIRHPDGSRLARPGFYPPRDGRHETHLAGIITSDDLLYYVGPDATRVALHLATTGFRSSTDYDRIVYFGPHELKNGSAQRMVQGE